MITHDIIRLIAPLSFDNNMKNLFKYRICLLKILLISLLVLITGCANNDKDDEIKYLQVKIYTESGYGSGVITDVNDEGVVITTALHVISDWNENGHIEYFDKSSSFGLKVGALEKEDICLLEVPSDYLDSSLYDKLKKIVKPDSYIESINLEFNKGDDFKFFDMDIDRICKGKLISAYEYNYELDNMVILGECIKTVPKEGLSGIGVYNNDNVLIGILIAGNENGIIAIKPIY